jgi:hypothetical protein
LIGAFFTGRTFFVGLGVGLLMCYLCNIPKKIKLNYTLKCVIVFISLLLIIISLLPEELYNHVLDLIWYVFEAAFNYAEYGTLSTSSSDTLMDDMYFPISLSTFFFGDGLYTESDGAYYMHTDSGYMRNVLFGGIPYLLLCIAIDYYILFSSSLPKDKSIRFLSKFVFLYLFILHVKGESFAYLITIHCIIYTLYLFYVCKEKIKLRQIKINKE